MKMTCRLRLSNVFVMTREDGGYNKLSLRTAIEFRNVGHHGRLEHHKSAIFN